MILYIQGKAPASVLKDLGIIPASTEVPDHQDVCYITHVLETRTSSSACDLLEILRPSENPFRACVDGLWLKSKDFTNEMLEKIEAILEVAGEPDHVETLKTLRDEGNFQAFIDSVS